MWIFQKLDLHQLIQNCWKQCAPNFISCEFAAIQTSLVQGGLVIPIKVTVQWKDEWAMEILRRKTEDVGYHLREMDQYEDQLNSVEEPDESRGKTLQEAYTGMVAVNTWNCRSLDTVNIVSGAWSSI